MKSLKKRWGFLIVLVVMALFTAACGANNDAEENANNQNPEEQNESSENSEGNGQSLLAEIKENGVIQVGIMGTYPPYNFLNEDQEMTGFDAEIAKEVASRIGVDVEFNPTPWSGMLAGLRNDKFDAVVSQVTITEDRKKNLDFSQPYITNTVNIIVPQDSTSIQSLEDFKGQTIGIGLGTNDEAYLRNEVKPEVGEFTIKTYDDVITTLKDLNSGRIDATINNKFAIKPVVEENNLKIKAVGEPVKQDQAGIAIRPENPELLAAIDQALTEMKEDGTYRDIFVKWFDEEPNL